MPVAKQLSISIRRFRDPHISFALVIALENLACYVNSEPLWELAIVILLFVKFTEKRGWNLFFIFSWLLFVAIQHPDENSQGRPIDAAIAGLATIALLSHLRKIFKGHRE